MSGALEIDRVGGFFESVESRILAPWPKGRADLHWHIIPAAEDATKITHAYHRIAHRPGLHPIPPEWIHITLMHGGPVDQYTERELRQIHETVTAACRSIPPLTLTAGRPEIGRRAVTLPVWPGPPLRALWDLTRVADAGATSARAPVLPLVYAPHLTLAYGATPGAHRPQLQADRADLNVHEMTLHVSRLALVAQTHDGEGITWRTLTTVPLTGEGIG